MITIGENINGFCCRKKKVKELIMKGNNSDSSISSVDPVGDLDVLDTLEFIENNMDIVFDDVDVAVVRNNSVVIGSKGEGKGISSLLLNEGKIIGECVVVPGCDVGGSSSSAIIAGKIGGDDDNEKVIYESAEDVVNFIQANPNLVLSQEFVIIDDVDDGGVGGGCGVGTSSIRDDAQEEVVIYESAEDVFSFIQKNPELVLSPVGLPPLDNDIVDDDEVEEKVGNQNNKNDNLEENVTSIDIIGNSSTTNLQMISASATAGLKNNNFDENDVFDDVNESVNIVAVVIPSPINFDSDNVEDIPIANVPPVHTPPALVNKKRKKRTSEDNSLGFGKGNCLEDENSNEEWDKEWDEEYDNFAFVRTSSIESERRENVVCLKKRRKCSFGNYFSEMCEEGKEEEEEDSGEEDNSGDEDIEEYSEVVAEKDNRREEDTEKGNNSNSSSEVYDLNNNEFDKEWKYGGGGGAGGASAAAVRSSTATVHNVYFPPVIGCIHWFLLNYDPRTRIPNDEMLSSVEYDRGNDNNDDNNDSSSNNNSGINGLSSSIVVGQNLVDEQEDIEFSTISRADFGTDYVGIVQRQQLQQSEFVEEDNNRGDDVVAINVRELYEEEKEGNKLLEEGRSNKDRVGGEEGGKEEEHKENEKQEEQKEQEEQEEQEVQEVQEKRNEVVFEEVEEGVLDVVESDSSVAAVEMNRDNDVAGIITRDSNVVAGTEILHMTTRSRSFLNMPLAMRRERRRGQRKVGQQKYIGSKWRDL